MNPDACHAALDRIVNFLEQSTRRQAERVLDSAVGFTVLHSDYPASYDHNKVVITRSVDGVNPVAIADITLAQVGLAHRLVIAERDELGCAIADAFVRDGYHHQENLIMRYDGPPAGQPATPQPGVVQVDASELAEFDRSGWRVELPDVSAEVIEQLVTRRATRVLAAEQVAFLAVRDATGHVVASADLYLDAGFGTAQIEDLRTDPAHRNRGFARALLAEGIRRATRWGADIQFLVAAADDWPRHLYRRLGYVEVGRSHLFSRVPASA